MPRQIAGSKCACGSVAAQSLIPVVGVASLCRSGEGTAVGPFFNPESSMSAFTILNEYQAQAINAGWRPRGGSYTSIKDVRVSLKQSNTANNLGLGALLGDGSASSEQSNYAEIITTVG